MWPRCNSFHISGLLTRFQRSPPCHDFLFLHDGRHIGGTAMFAKKFFRLPAILGMVVVAGLAGRAWAADLPTTKGLPAPPLPAPFSWTGFYVGLHAGGAWDSDAWHFLIAGTHTHNDAQSAFGGGQAGYNYQISSFVLGVEGDISGAHLASSNPCP